MIENDHCTLPSKKKASFLITFKTFWHISILRFLTYIFTQNIAIRMKIASSDASKKYVFVYLKKL